MDSAARPIHHDLVDHLAAIVWEADPRTFQFIYASRGAEALLGYSLEDWLSRPTFWIDLLHPDDREAAVTVCRAAVDDGRDHDFEYRVVTADGSVRRLRDIVSVRCDAAGRAERLCGLMIDVTATTAETSRDQEDRYRRMIVEHGLDLMVITDASGAILFESPSVEAVFGVSPGAGRRHSIFEMIHPDDAEGLTSFVAAAFSSGGAATTPVQLRYRHGDGSWRLLEALGRRVEDEHGPIVVINARDVTDRVRLEEEFRQAQKMEALALITSAVAHDLNNVLTVIRGNVDLALADTGKSVRAELLDIRTAAELASRLIAQLTTFDGRTRSAVVVDVNDTLRTLRTILERLLYPAAALSVNADATRPRVQMEGGALEQVLINLAVNAREALRATGRVHITTRNVRIADPGPGHTIRDFIEIEVADTGAGMTPETRERIFELYFTTKDAARGTGHGLATVYAIVRDAGGTITVDTEPGRGTTFRIRLPLIAS